MLPSKPMDTPPPSFKFYFIIYPMAFPSSTTIFLLFLLSAASMLPSHAQLITIQGVQVAGRLFCTVSGNPPLLCPSCGGLAGVNVTITCNGATTSVGSVLTDASGFFTTVLNLAGGLLFDNSALPCFVSVKLPVANCTLLAPTGTLRAPVTYLGNIVTSAIGLVAQAVTGLFVLVPL